MSKKYSIGFFIGIILLVVLYFTPTILNHPYLYPLIPFNFNKLKELLIRVPIDSKNS